jgi:regulator of RNase E activity RraA
MHLQSTKAVAGGLFLTESCRKHLAGLVIDGPVRDVSPTMERFCDRCLCFATSVTPYSGTIQSLGEMQQPIVCAGDQVSPGDIVVGDGDGVVVGTVNTMEKLLDTAESITRLEDKVMDAMEHSGVGFKL